jgi:hypothetical protein
MTKSAIRFGVAAYYQGRERLAEWSEEASDIVAEVQSEQEQQLQAEPQNAQATKSPVELQLSGGGTRHAEQSAHG